MALLGFKLRMKDRMSSFLISTESILALVIYWKSGRTLLLMINVHCFEKKSLKSLAFSLQQIMKVPLSRIGGIFGVRDLFITLYIIFQYFLGEVSESFRELASFSRYNFFAVSIDSLHSVLRASRVTLSSSLYPSFFCNYDNAYLFFLTNV